MGLVKPQNQVMAQKAPNPAPDLASHILRHTKSSDFRSFTLDPRQNLRGCRIGFLKLHENSTTRSQVEFSSPISTLQNRQNQTRSAWHPHLVHQLPFVLTTRALPELVRRCAQVVRSSICNDGLKKQAMIGGMGCSGM